MLLQELMAWKLKLLTFINGIPQFVLVATVIVLVLLLFKKKTPIQPWWIDVEWPFYAKQLLSQPEQVLFHRLAKALPDHIVLAQVQVSQVLGVKKGVNFYEWNDRINRLSYDFVICNKDGSVTAVIELDDKSHESKERIDVDKRKDKATASAGIRMIRWHVKSLPDEIIIKSALTPSSDLLLIKEDAAKSEVVFKLKI